MLTETKVRLTYITIGTYFFFGGIEYAVILPTLWLYLNTVFHAPPYLLGIVLSSFSVADLLSGMFLGRLSDKTQQTKLLLILTNVFQAVGSFLYIVDVGPEMLVISRLVTGFGSGISAPLIGDLARVIPDSERTSTLSVFFALRQAGLVLGPACNLFLGRFDFYFASYHVNKYTSPGFFMMVLWIIHEVMSIFMFWNLPALQSNKSLVIDEVVCAVDVNDARHPDIANGFSVNVESGINNLQNEQESTANDAFPNPNTALNEDKKGNAHDSINPRIAKRSRSVDGAARTAIQKTEHQGFSDSLACGSDDYIETAELLIRLNTALRCRPNLTASLSKNCGLNSQRGIFPYDVLTGGMIPDDDDDAPAFQGLLFQPRSHTVSNEINSSSTLATLHLNSTNIDYDVAKNSNEVERPEDHWGSEPFQPHHVLVVDNHSINQSAPHLEDSYDGDDPTYRGQTKLSLFRKLFKSYLIVLLMAVFIGYFNQLALEALLTPLTQKFLSWNEMENSYLYCAAGVEIILVFLLIRPISHKLEDKWLIVIGLLLQLISITVLMGYAPWASEDRKLENLVVFVVAIFINLIGLPMLVVCSNSLFTRLVPSDIQGFSQGVRKIFGGVGTILGPLWAGGTIDNLLALFGVMVATTCIALVLLLASFRELTPAFASQVGDDPAQTHASPNTSSHSISNQTPDDETTPLLPN